MKALKFLELISEVTQLDHHQRSVLIMALEQLSNEPKVNELIETAFDSKGICPHCSHTKIYRHGLVNGIQRYRCKACKKTFNALTGTPLAHLRYRSKWLDYLDGVSQPLTVRQAATTLNIHRNTAFRWRHRKRGISDEQICILIARDRSKQTVDFMTGNGPITKSVLAAYLKPVLDPDALLVSDSNPTYDAFCKAEHITHETVNLSQGQRVKGAYHVQNVNAYHSRFKAWLDHFHGVATKYLPNYLGWCRTMDQHSNITPDMLLNSALGNFQHLTVT